MKTLIKSAIIGLALVGAAHAVPNYVTQNSTENVSTTGTSFTFNQFDSSLGTLNAVDLIIQSSTLQGNITLTRTSGSRNFTDLTAGLSFDPAAGFSGYDTTALSYLRTPSGSFTINATSSSRLITVNGTTQSLIGGSPVTLSINSGSFGSYTGLSTVSFSTSILLGDVNTGSGSFTTTSSNLISPTTLALRYTYSTTPSGVPEPGQVAASVLLLSGIGGYFFIKRRRKSPAVA